MDTLQLKFFVLGNIGTMDFIENEAQLMSVANNLFDWLMEEVKVEEGVEPTQLSLAIDNNEPVN